MRVHFRARGIEPFQFSVQGVAYGFNESRRFAEKRNLQANIYEYVLETPDGKKIWLTVVGPAEESPPTGVDSGWYVAEILSEKNAAFLIEALAPFTELYQP